MTTIFEKTENDKYFIFIISLLQDSGFWIWQDEGEVFERVDGKFKPKTKIGYRKIKNITTKKFHKKYLIKK